jgi:hypothetical protein
MLAVLSPALADDGGLAFIAALSLLLAASLLAVIWQPAQAGGAAAGQTRRHPAQQEPAREQPLQLLRPGRHAEAPPAGPARAPLPVRPPGQSARIAPLTSDPARQDAPAPPGVSGGPPWEPAPKPPGPGP